MITFEQTGEELDIERKGRTSAGLPGPTNGFGDHRGPLRLNEEVCH